MHIANSIMENYNKFVPKLRKKFDKVQLKEIPGWRNRNSQQGLEMKIESKVPAYVKDRSDFNKNLIYPQWDLPIGITYSPKVNKGIKKINHFRNKSEQELLKQLDNRLSPIKEVQTVYLKKVRFVEDLGEEEVKKVEGFRLQENKRNEAFDEIESEKVQLPVTFYEFSVKENKDFDFVRNKSEEEFFSKEGFRVSQQNAYLEKVFLRDRINEETEEDCSGINLRGKWEIKIHEDKIMGDERNAEVGKSEKKEKNKKKISKAQKIEVKLKKVKINEVGFEEDKLKGANINLGVNEGDIKVDNQKGNIIKEDYKNEDVKKEDNFKEDTVKSENKKPENIKVPNTTKEGAIINENKKQEPINMLEKKEDNIKKKLKFESNTKKTGIKKDKLKANKNLIDKEKVSKKFQDREKNLKNVEIKFYGNPKKTFPVKLPEQNPQLLDNEEKSSQSPCSKLANPSIPQTTPETPKQVLQEIEFLPKSNPELTKDPDSSSSSNRMSISPSVYKNLHKAKTISTTSHPGLKLKISRKPASTEDLQEVDYEVQVVPDEITGYIQRQKENYTIKEHNSDIYEEENSEKTFKRTERRTKSLTSNIRIKDLSGKLKKKLKKSHKKSPKFSDESKICDTPIINQPNTELDLAVLQKSNTVIVKARNFSETVHEESAEEEQNKTSHEENSQGVKTDKVKVVNQKFNDVKNKLSLNNEKYYESFGTNNPKKQDSNIFARKNRKSLIVVPNVPQVKEETLESSNILQVSKAAKNSSNPNLSKILKKTSKILSVNELKGIDLPNLKKALRTYADKTPDEQKEEKRIQSQQKQKKIDDPTPGSSKQLPNARQRNSIRVEIKDFAGQKKLSNLPNLSEKFRRKGKKRETYNSSVCSSDNVYDSADSEEMQLFNKDRNLNTLQYELNLLEKSKKIDSPMPEEDKAILKSSSQVENSESSSSFDAGVDVDKEMTDLAKTKNFHLSSLVLNKPISFKFNHKVEMNSGVNVNELEINENNKDLKNLDYFMRKQRFLNFRSNSQLDFDQGIFYLHVKDVEEGLPGETAKKTGQKFQSKEMTQDLLKSKSGALGLKQQTMIKSALKTQNFSIFRKRQSFNWKTGRDALVKFDDKDLKNSGVSFYRIRNARSLQSLDFHQSESARDLLNSIKASMEILEKVYDS